jgi:hypothetical protein
MEAFYNIYNKQTKEDPHRKPRGTILILDRKFDMISPLVHNYQYQSAVYDYLDVSIEESNVENVINIEEVLSKQELE